MTVVQYGLARMVFGPQHSRAESLITATGTASVIALLAAYIDRADGWSDWSALQMVAAAAIIFDLIFGMFTISTPTAKRWYHRPGATALRFRCTFVLGSALQMVAAAALFGSGLAWAMVNACLLLGAASIVEFAPADLKRLVAIGLTMAAALTNFVWMPLPAALAWLPALLFAKILLCFLLPESG